MLYFCLWIVVQMFWNLAVCVCEHERITDQKALQYSMCASMREHIF